MSDDDKRTKRTPAGEKAADVPTPGTAVNPPPPSSNVLVIEVTSRDPAEQAKQVAAASLRPNMGASSTVLEWGDRRWGVDVTALSKEISKQGDLVAGGDLSRLEHMLTAHAHSLDAIFNKYAHLARLNLNEYPQASESFMRLALKAQTQCRATIETVAAVKNPPSVAFVKQANIAGGHQQVNNEAPARGNPFQSNEVLEAHEQLEHRAPQAAGVGDPTMATLGPIDRPEVQARQAPLQPQRSKTRRKVA